MKLTKSYLRNIINEEIDATLEEARLGVKRAAQDIAERFGGKFYRDAMHVSVGGGKKMATIQFFAVFDEREQRDEAWDELLSEGEDIGPHMSSRNPIILWNGVKLYKLPFHYGPDSIATAIGVASKGKIDNIPESRGYTDNPDGASGSRSHPKSYQRRPADRSAESEQDAWRAGGSDLYEKGKKDSMEGRPATVSREEDNSHRHYSMGYGDGIALRVRGGKR